MTQQNPYYDAQSGTATASTATPVPAQPPCSPGSTGLHPGRSSVKPKLHDKPSGTVAAAACTTSSSAAAVSANEKADNKAGGNSERATTHASLPPNATADYTGFTDAAAASATTTSTGDLASGDGSAPLSAITNDVANQGEKSNSLPRNLHKPPRPPRPVTMISRESLKADSDDVSASSKTCGVIAEQTNDAAPSSSSKSTASSTDTTTGKDKKMSVSEETRL